MCYFEAEPCAVHRSSFPVSRKRRRCDGCGGWIQAGAQYERCFFVFEGEAGTDNACLACVAVQRAFMEEHGSAPNYNWLRDALLDCYDGAENKGRRDEDAQPWRDAMAGMLRRQRAAKREAA